MFEVAFRSLLAALAKFAADVWCAFVNISGEKEQQLPAMRAAPRLRSEAGMVADDVSSAIEDS